LLPNTSLSASHLVGNAVIMPPRSALSSRIWVLVNGNWTQRQALLYQQLWPCTRLLTLRFARVRRGRPQTTSRARAEHPRMALHPKNAVCRSFGRKPLPALPLTSIVDTPEHASRIECSIDCTMKKHHPSALVQKLVIPAASSNQRIGSNSLTPSQSGTSTSHPLLAPSGAAGETCGAMSCKTHLIEGLASGSPRM
jgi:hypothetical protein